MTDTIHAIIKDAHELAKADAAPDLVKPAVETIALRLERLVKDGFYVTPAAAREFAEEQAKKDATPIDPNGPTLNQILLNPPLPELTAPVVRTRIVVTPNGAAMKYDPLDDELPRLSAHIDTVTRPDGGKASQACTLYVGGEVLAYMAIYRGKHFAVRMVKQALKGAMSKLGRRRRNKANRRAREAAASGAANV
jgi:hypothetical protein